VGEGEAEKLRDKFGYVPCELCVDYFVTERRVPWLDENSSLLVIIEGHEWFHAEGHHNNHDRRDSSPANCRILHGICNQQLEDHNIKDIKSLLD